MSLFISLEGPDGSGKTTQASLLAAHFRAQGHAVTETREPGGTELGEKIRHLVLDPSSPSATPLAMTLLLSAARAELVAKVIRPALDAGDVVITDRFADSTVAYQSFGLGLPLDTARDLIRIATGGLRPDIVVYVDLPPGDGEQRMTVRGSRDRLDAASTAFQQRVREGYAWLAREDPARWIVVDGRSSQTEVHAAIVRALQKALSAV